MCATSGEGATSMMIRQPSSSATWARHMSRLNAKGTRPIGVQVAPTPYFGNMIVERLPWVAPLPEPWEAEYQQWSDERRQKFLKKLPESLVNPKAGRRRSIRPSAEGDGGGQDRGPADHAPEAG